jgi:hypothetical protein
MRTVSKRKHLWLPKNSIKKVMGFSTEIGKKQKMKKNEKKNGCLHVW